MECRLIISDNKLMIEFVLNPRSLTRQTNMSIILKLTDNVLDYKEALLTQSNIKFQSCYPIIYYFLAQTFFKQTFYPSVKPDELAKRVGVKDYVVLNLLNSMGKLCLISLLVPDHYYSAVRLFPANSGHIQPHLLYQVRSRCRSMSLHAHVLDESSSNEFDCFETNWLHHALRCGPLLSCPIDSAARHQLVVCLPDPEEC